MSNRRLSKRVDLETAGVIAGGLCALAAVCIGCAQGACLKHDPHDTPPRGGLMRLQPISQGNMNAGRPEGYGVESLIITVRKLISSGVLQNHPRGTDEHRPNCWLKINVHFHRPAAEVERYSGAYPCHSVAMTNAPRNPFCQTPKSRA